MTLKTRIRRIWRRTLFTFVVGALVAVLLCHDGILTAGGRWLNVSTPIDQTVDDVFVLGGEVELRPLAAAAIIRAGMGKRVLVPQVVATAEVVDEIIPPQHELVRLVLIKSGVPAESVVILPVVVDSTEREARCLADYLDENPGHRVAVVTSDYHTRRTRSLFIQACHGKKADLTFVGAPTDGYCASNWWQFESGLVQYVNEYLKLAKAAIH